MAEYDALVAEVDERGLSAAWMRQAQHLTVSLLMPLVMIWFGKGSGFDARRYRRV
jgi:hypothetical protein